MRVPVRPLPVLCVLLAAACAAPAGGPAALPPPAAQVPAGLGVALEQSRDNENRRLLQVVLTHAGDVPVAVEALQLDADGWTDVPATPRADLLRPRRRLAFPVAYGQPRCDRSGGAQVLLQHRTTDGLQQVRLPVPADDPTLKRLHRRECAVAALERAVDLSFAPQWERRGDAALGRLIATRRSGTASVRVTGIEGTVLFTLRPVAALPLPVPGELPVEVTVSRCDPHAVTESKRSYDFPAYVAVDDEPPLYVTVRPGEPGRGLLEQLLVQACREQLPG